MDRKLLSVLGCVSICQGFTACVDSGADDACVVTANGDRGNVYYGLMRCVGGFGSCGVPIGCYVGYVMFLVQ